MVSDEAKQILIEVAYALPEEQVLMSLHVNEGTTLEQAVEQSGILKQFPDIELGKTNKVGIFGKLGKLDMVLREKDRVEIYRPLIADPKAVRKQRAAEGKQMRKGGEGEAAETTAS